MIATTTLIKRATYPSRHVLCLKKVRKIYTKLQQFIVFSNTVTEQFILQDGFAAFGNISCLLQLALNRQNGR